MPAKGSADGRVISPLGPAPSSPATPSAVGTPTNPASRRPRLQPRAVDRCRSRSLLFDGPVQHAGPGRAPAGLGEDGRNRDIETGRWRADDHQDRPCYGGTGARARRGFIRRARQCGQGRMPSEQSSGWRARDHPRSVPGVLALSRRCSCRGDLSGGRIATGEARTGHSLGWHVGGILRRVRFAEIGRAAHFQPLSVVGEEMLVETDGSFDSVHPPTRPPIEEIWMTIPPPCSRRKGMAALETL